MASRLKVAARVLNSGPFRQTTIGLSAPAGQGAHSVSHILGRRTVLLNIDEVIAIIRQSDEPSVPLIRRFAGVAGSRGHPWKSACASAVARLQSHIKIEQELKSCAREQAGRHLGNPAAADDVSEIGPTKQFADPHHAIQAEEKNPCSTSRCSTDRPVTGGGQQPGLDCAHPAATCTRQLAFKDRR
jgi:hypothetical protein